MEFSMANEKEPRSSTTARRTSATPTTPRAPRSPKAKLADTIAPATTAPVEATVSLPETPSTTAQATIATARNAVIEGNATIDADAVRRRAYELYEERGRLDGYHEQDWYSAEQELSGRKPQSQNSARTRGRNGDGKRTDSQRSA
jgi:hypothetical protein